MKSEHSASRTFGVPALLFAAAALFFGLIGLSVYSPYVAGVNSSSVVTRVNITNQGPSVYSVQVDDNVFSPAEQIDLTAGSTATVNCTGRVSDTNGWDDITNTSATFYKLITGSSAPDDRNNHYTNGSCNCSQINSSDVSCTCMFNVFYYADNAIWECNFTARDSFGLNHSNNDTAAVSELLALNVPSEIDYGNISVTATSAQKNVSINNYGNVAINISVLGYGGDNATTGDNLSMICQTGNISVDMERYSPILTQAFDQMFNLTNASATVSNFTLTQRTVDGGFSGDTNSTYWRLRIPTGVSGLCNGTVVFSAVRFAP